MNPMSATAAPPCRYGRSRNDRQEQYADDVGDGENRRRVLRRRQPGERDQGGHRDRDVGQVVLDHFDVLARGAV